MNLKHALASTAAVTVVCALSYYFVDVPLHYLLASHHGPVKDFFGTITYFGLSTAYLVMSFSLFVWFRFFRRQVLFSNMALFVFSSVALSGILNSAFKFIFGRCRPGLLLDENLYGFTFFATGYNHTSFPSGHANTVAALFLAVYLISGRRFGWILLPSALPLAASRVIIGSHFLSDVIFGAFLAILTTLLLRDGFEKNGLSVSWSANRAG